MHFRKEIDIRLILLLDTILSINTGYTFQKCLYNTFQFNSIQFNSGTMLIKSTFAMFIVLCFVIYEKRFFK